MSISFLQIPDAISSGFDPMNFVVSSTASHNTQFRFNSELLDENGDTIASFINLKQPTYGNLLFDAHRTIEKYLSYDISNLIAGTTGWQLGVNVFKKFQLKVIEEHPQLVFHASGVSSYVIAINSAMNWQDYVNFELGDRYASNSSRNWLTNQPTRIKVRIGDSYELGTIDAGSAIDTNLSYLKIETYNSAGTLIQTATKSNPYTALATDSARFMSILVGPDDLNATTLTTGSQPLITDSVHYYRVASFNSVNTQTLEWKEFELDRSCTRDDTYTRLYFLNSLGRFDAFNFDFIRDDSIQSTKARYNKLLGVLTASTFTYNTYQQETSVFHSKVEQKYRLRSGFVDNDTAEWLKELIASPLVYMIAPINSGNTFVAVTVDNSTYQAKKTEVEKLFNIEIDITLSTITQRQRL